MTFSSMDASPAIMSSKRKGRKSKSQSGCLRPMKRSLRPAKILIPMRVNMFLPLSSQSPKRKRLKKLIWSKNSGVIFLTRDSSLGLQINLVLGLKNKWRNDEQQKSRDNSTRKRQRKNLTRGESW